MSRGRFDARELADLLAPRLIADDGPEERDSTLTPSAVLVPLLDSDAGPALLFTRRSQSLPDHAGQIAFPGGVHDAGDASLRATALREAGEEVDVDPNRIEILGALDRISTLAKYRIQPFLALWPAGDYGPGSPDEVERVFQVPLDWLADSANESRVRIDLPGRRLSVPAWVWEGEVIWGATRFITTDLLARLRLCP
jgi:8-oxo-dGTP pyrophosphatase MutT (NUDIX family)